MLQYSKGIFDLGWLCYIRRRPEFRFVAKDIFKVVSNARKVKKNNPE